MRAFLVAACLAAVAGPAMAETYPAHGVDIVYAAANLHVIPEDRADIAVQTTAGPRVPAPSVRLTGGRVVIDGGLRNRLRGCGGFIVMGSTMPVQIAGIGGVQPANLPTITLRVPRTLDITSSGAVFGDVGASNGGRAQFQGCGSINMAAVNGPLDLEQHGSGDVRVADINGTLRGELDGSGDLRVGRISGGADVTLDGSGDVNIASVGGIATASLDGSGDLNIGAIGRSAGLRLDGSGDLAVGAVQGGVEARVDGSGAVTIASVQSGRVVLELDGSGDLIVRGGQAERLAAHNGGSGTIAFHGRATSLEAALSGSGDISVGSADHVESMSDHGSGEIHIGH